MADITGTTPDTRVPTVVVDDVHITYTVNGARTGRGSATSALNRIVSRGQPRGARKVHAVKGVSFAAYKGEAIGLIGSNGSGKSTLLKAVAGLLPPSRGQVHTQGQPSLLGVNAALMSDLTGERNVVLGGLAMGMTRAQIRERYQDIVDFSGINEKGDFITLPMRTYSSGMGARLRFSIAAAKSHDVLLIDEALSTGDARFQRRSKDRIMELREQAGTVFLVSHSNRSITDTCDRALWLEAGTLRMDGPAKEVVAAYEEFTGPVKKPKKK
ncbi:MULTISPECIES: ABC transporter ATP-binding protein [Streptomyces]|uniref:ABC transporter ATP-binding protein n=1 Tax=Streptomyces halstedii TaxID=1944 RepID=A0A6N9U3H4_STRHA|nr:MULTISPECIES: ABC transporter ATP-binding protein [unclassified Streptomyces]AWL38770.1 ABC transporter ATP-binding protein [Streptomyces sp. SM18]NEA18188.1 ABC transporter ATP-binding protein [Streptomyces halstedii]